MDLIVTLLLVIGLGFFKSTQTGQQFDAQSVVIREANGITRTVSYKDIPIGNNLMLKKEPDAFMKIVKQLGLVR